MSKTFKIILVVLVSLFALIIIIGVLVPTEEEEATPTIVGKTQKSERVAKKETPKPKQTAWYKVAQWQGKSIKNTETFNISSREWRISWETKAGEYGEMNFQIYVYNSDGDLVSVAANVIGYDKDSTIIRGKGSYYLMINTAQPYTIIVEERR